MFGRRDNFKEIYKKLIAYAEASASPSEVSPATSSPSNEKIKHKIDVFIKHNANKILKKAFFRKWQSNCRNATKIVKAVNEGKTKISEGKSSPGYISRYEYNKAKRIADEYSEWKKRFKDEWQEKYPDLPKAKAKKKYINEKKELLYKILTADRKEAFEFIVHTLIIAHLSHGIKKYTALDKFIQEITPLTRNDSYLQLTNWREWIAPAIESQFSGNYLVLDIKKDLSEIQPIQSSKKSLDKKPKTISLGESQELIFQLGVALKGLGALPTYVDGQDLMKVFLYLPAPIGEALMSKTNFIIRIVQSGMEKNPSFMSTEEFIGKIKEKYEPLPTSKVPKTFADFYRRLNENDFSDDNNNNNNIPNLLGRGGP